MSGLVIDGDILIEAPAEVVWRTVTEPDQMSQWFADRVDLVVEPGARGYLQFGDQGDPVVVEVVDPPTRSTGTAGRSTWSASPACSRSAERDDGTDR